MSTLEDLPHALKDTLANITDGWQQLWQKARNSITYFSPSTQNTGIVSSGDGVRWGVMSADVKETDSDLEVCLESPGMKSDEFEIRVERRTLSVRGTKHYRADRTDGKFHITERAYGSFERLIPLPCFVEEHNASASYKGGVLHIRLPKRKDEKVRRIPVS